MICLKLFPEKKLIYLLILSWNLCGRTFPLGLSLGASISLTFDCFLIMTRVCIFFSTFRFSDFCGYQVLSPSSYRFIVTIILQGHPASSVALWGYPLCWPPSVRFRVQLTSVCLHTSPLTTRSTCYGTTVPHFFHLLNLVNSDGRLMRLHLVLERPSRSVLTAFRFWLEFRKSILTFLRLFFDFNIYIYLEINVESFFLDVVWILSILVSWQFVGGPFVLNLVQERLSRSLLTAFRFWLVFPKIHLKKTFFDSFPTFFWYEMYLRHAFRMGVDVIFH